jgi:co-chaperonin GroES (HSP10)
MTVTALATSTAHATSIDTDDKWLGENIDPAKIPVPERFQLAVKQVGLRKQSAGGILLPDQVVDNQKWLQGVGVVVAKGPAVYRGKKFEDMGLHPNDAPKVGDLVMFEARAPRRAEVDGETILYIPDDAAFARPTRDQLKYLDFGL